jgi:hypothetical protein
VLSGAMISMGRTLEKLGPALYSPECVEVEFSEVPRTKASGILKNLWHPQESTTSIGSQASSLESR